MYNLSCIGAVLINCTNCITNTQRIVGVQVSSRVTKDFLIVIMHILIDFGLEKIKNSKNFNRS
jgi:hypothetical protein